MVVFLPGTAIMEVVWWADKQNAKNEDNCFKITHKPALYQDLQISLFQNKDLKEYLIFYPHLQSSTIE